MHQRNRVFFANEKEAIQSGYRPCGNCMPAAFRKWSANN
ncbi:MAG TPA: Ada metal-binding domain-containing protein [Cyclobacteriaceae bacterium]|nr:hypothetical protein [Cyclobacteriaceae bacterium]HOO08313.1 Ada metal-binding domain-containing protein [Cyclobacteriaceae bacterium]HPI79109.1 Ada metal-binding domain-containing protein [Cyclobacteriaceae bacterium]